MKTKIIKSEPYFSINMECSNRAFYGVKDKLWKLCCIIDPEQEIDLWNGYKEESCDYEGDLNKIKIYNCDKTKGWINLIIKEFEITDEIPEGMTVIFSVI